MSKDQVFLLLFIVESPLSEYHGELVNWENHFANSTHHKVQVVPLLIYFLQIISFGYHFLNKEYFEILDNLPRNSPEFRHEPKKILDFLLSGTQLRILHNVVIFLRIKYQNLCLFPLDPRVISPLLLSILLKPKICINIDPLGELELIFSLTLDHQLDISRDQKVEAATNSTLFVEELLLLDFQKL